MNSEDRSSELYMSPEAVALQLLICVFAAENRPINGPDAGNSKLSRALILDAYSDCLEAVKGARPRKGKP